MPTLNAKYLSQQKLDTGAGPTLLSAGTLSPQSAVNAFGSASQARLQAPQLRAAQTTAPQYTNLVGPAVEQLGKTVGKAIVAYSDSKTSLLATDSFLEFNKQARALTEGAEVLVKDPVTGKETTEFKTGYYSETGRSAFTNHGQAVANLDVIRNTIADSLDPSAQAKFLAKSQGVYTSIQTRMSQVAASGKRQWQSDQIGQRRFQFSNQLASMPDTDPKAKQGAIVEFFAGLQRDYPVSAADAMAGVQDFHKLHIANLSSLNNASSKLLAYRETVGPTLGIENQTILNNEIRQNIRQENADVERQASRADRLKRQRREDVTRTMYSSVDQGNFDDNKYRAMRDAGIISQGDYTSAQRRAWGQTYLQPATPTEKVQFYEGMLLGQKGATDIERWDAPRSDRDAMTNRLIGIKDDTKKAEYRGSHENFKTALIQKGIPKGEGMANRLLDMNFNYDEHRKKGISDYEAQNRVLESTGLSAKYSGDDPITIPGRAGINPKSLQEVNAIGNELRQMVDDGTLTDQATIQKLRGQLSLYRNKFISQQSEVSP